MYDGLVKRLRYCRNNAAVITDDELMAIADQAADAIEELNRDLDFAVRAEAAAVKSCTPRWIPVAERLPEKPNHYLVYIECKCDREFMSAWVQVAWFCEKFYWEHLHGDDVFKETVTHWMPLPKPPKEEN